MTFLYECSNSPCNNLFLLARFDFSGAVDLDGIMGSMFTTGFQATNVGLAIDEINNMVRKQLI